MTSKNTSPGEEKTERRGMPPRVAPSKPESSPNPPARTPTEATPPKSTPAKKLRWTPLLRQHEG